MRLKTVGPIALKFNAVTRNTQRASRILTRRGLFHACCRGGTLRGIRCFPYLRVLRF